VTLTWHGVMIVLGIGAGSWLAQRYARERGLDSEALWSAILAVVAGGIVGARLYYLIEHEPGSLVRPVEWLGTNGFSFYGAMIAAGGAVAVYLWRRRLGLDYLDALAAGFPPGMAVGRVGDVINGEHFGPPTTAPWGFRYTDAEAAVPSTEVAYHSGAFYEVLLALLMLGLLWPLRTRVTRPGALLWLTIGLYALGRLGIFFVIRDTDVVALGLRQAQLTSLALVVASGVGLWIAYRRGTAPKAGAPAARPTVQHSR